MNFKNYSKPELKKLVELLRTNPPLNSGQIIDEIETYLDNEVKTDKIEAKEFKSKMIEKYKGKSFKVIYNKDHTTFYKITDLVIPDGCTSAYNVLLIGEEIVCYEKRIEVREIDIKKELRLDNTNIGVHTHCVEIPNYRFKALRRKYENILLHIDGNI